MSEKGNTIGRLYGQVPMSGAPAWAANPPIVAETPEEAAWIAKMLARQDAPVAIREVSALFDETNALVYAGEDSAAEPETSRTAGQAAKPWRGEDGAKVLGRGDPAICMECLVHAASSGVVSLERQ